MKTKNILNQKFGKLLVVEKLGVNKDKRILWLCLCDCGNKISTIEKSLRTNKTKTCGCGKKLHALKHGMSQTRFYKIWKAMRNRCNDNNDILYGAKGIKVCKKWNNFFNFKKDMYNSYLVHIKYFGEKNTSIDRINGNKGYSLKNCRWATPKIQCGNTTKNKIFIALSPNGKKYSSNNQSEFSRNNNLLISNVNNCLNSKQSHHRGWKFKYLNPKGVYSHER